MKGARILIGVNEGEMASQLAHLAKAIPDATFKYLGFSWSTGHELRKMGLDFVHMPWRYRSKNKSKGIVLTAMPRLLEVAVPGYSEDSVPRAVARAYQELKEFIEDEIERFAPDLVIYGQMGYAVCRLLDEVAKGRGIPRMGLETCFVSDHYLVQSQGSDWQTYLQAIALSDLDLNKTSDGDAVSRMKLRTIKKGISAPRRFYFWIKHAERLGRTFSGGVSFETLPDLSSRMVSKMIERKWFPNHRTLDSIEMVRSGCVLVVLHQPLLSWDQPTWTDLITFALEATPPDIPIVIRPHPGEKAKSVPKNLESVLKSRTVYISRTQGPNLKELFQHCRAMITLNSALGVEGLLSEIPVFTLGPAYYSREGMAKAVKLSDSAYVRELLEGDGAFFRPNKTEVSLFVEWLMNEWMCPHPHLDFTGKNSLANRIRTVVDARQAVK